MKCTGAIIKIDEHYAIISAGDITIALIFDTGPMSFAMRHGYIKCFKILSANHKVCFSKKLKGVVSAGNVSITVMSEFIEFTKLPCDGRLSETATICSLMHSSEAILYV